MLDEYVDILDDSGTYTGRSMLKSEAHRLGLFHPSVHLWCYDKGGSVLLQQRGAQKEVHPLLWDVSVAGHVGAGEAIVTATIREAEEEIGVVLDPVKLQKIKVFKREKRHTKALFDREFTHTFLYELSQETPLVKQESEVNALQWVALDVFEKMARSKDKGLVPGATDRYLEIIEAIASRI